MTRPPRAPYEPVKDIPNIDKISANAKKSDELMWRVINSTRFTLNKPSNFKKPNAYKKELSGLLADQLRMFAITHGSIRELVGVAYKKDYYPVVGDALSLAREQVEKIFIIATLLDNPDKAFKQYLRAKWRTMFEDYLLDMEEHSENERFKTFLSDTLPQRLEELRHPFTSKGKTETLVSKFAIRALEFNWNNPAAKNPTWFKHKKSVRNYVRGYFDFATPGTSTKDIKDPSLRRFLYRWHKEYSFLSQYTHVTVGKMMFSHMHQIKDMRSQDDIKSYGQRHAIRAVHTSYTATASACAIILSGVAKTYGAKAELKEMWDELTGFSLLAKSLWKMYVEKLLI